LLFPAGISDEEVVASALADLRPGGAMLEYLNHACVAAILGQTLFVHGAVDAQTAGAEHTISIYQYIYLHIHTYTYMALCVCMQVHCPRTDTVCARRC